MEIYETFQIVISTPDEFWKYCIYLQTFPMGCAPRNIWTSSAKIDR